jgi:adenine deaminase
VQLANFVQLHEARGPNQIDRFQRQRKVSIVAGITSDKALGEGIEDVQRIVREENLPPVLTSQEVLEFATIEGAIANGLDHKVGSLRPGKEADIIMLATDRVNVMPINDPVGVVVRGMDASNVDSVFIAGKAKKRGGKLLDVDLARVKKLVYDSRDYVVQKSGFKLPAI